MSAITTAVVVGVAAAGASAGATVYAAKKGANAAKDAAKTQTDAANTALDFQKAQYNQGRQDFSPYQQQGAGALGRLASMAQNTPPQFRPGGGQPGPMTPPGQFGLSGMGGQAQPQQGPGLGALPQGLGSQSQGAPGSIGAFGMAPQGGQPAMVTMEGPDGVRKPVPSSVVPQLTQRGFKVIQ